MKIQIIVFGKTAESFFVQSQEHYIKRIVPFAKIEWKELKEEKIITGKTTEQIKQKEADRFFEIFSDKTYLIACDPQGKQFSSENFSEHLAQQLHYFPSITFVIGGALGLSDTILSRAHLRLSLSACTFPHDLFRTMLLEQIYRSLMIAGNREYHK